VFYAIGFGRSDRGKKTREKPELDSFFSQVDLYPVRGKTFFPVYGDSGNSSLLFIECIQKNRIGIKSTGK